jgi:hypothetical protein
LLVASTALGQTPEPPAEISLDSLSPSSPDLLRQFSLESHNPLINLMVDGEFTSVDADPPKESAKIKPKAQSKAAPDAKAEDDSASCDGSPVEIDCPSAPVCLPFACPCPPPPPQQCHCRKCQRKHGHGHHGCGGQGNGCGYGGYGYGGGYGNPYLNWPTCPAWCFYGAPLVPCEGGCGGGCGHHKHCRRHSCGHGGCGNQGCGYGGYGCGYGGWGGWNSMCGCGDGFGNNGWCGGCTPYVAPPPQQCNCRKCQRHHKHGCSNNNGYGGCGYGGYGYGCGYGGGWGMGWGGFSDGWCGGCTPYVAPPPQQCNCRKCQRHHHHGCSNNYGYAGYGCPGWSVDECNQGCGKHHRGRCHRHGGCQQPAPYASFGCPMMMPCMGGDLFCGDGAFGGNF